MKATLLVSSLGMAVALALPLRLLRTRINSKISDEQYFAAARKRAIGYRLAKAGANGHDAQAAGGE